MVWCGLAVATALLALVDCNVIVYTQSVPHEIADEFRDMPASFGADLPDDGLRGFVTPGVPADGCSALAPPPTDENFTKNWIVLVARYNCSFEVKVRNAQIAGYDCVIVHNVNSSDLETMSAKNADDIVIPSVFVSDIAGELLAGGYSYKNQYYVMVNGELPFNINTHLLLPFAIVVALCLLVMIVFMIVKCIKDRRRARRHRLPSRALRKIPTCKFSKGDPYDTCAICLDDYVEGERLRVLPCAHAYHAKCIDPWLTQNRRVCPVCKRRVLASGERRRRYSSDSGSDSDDSREPLVRSQEQPTQGGTFEQQSENPFQRAARFMARLRRNRDNAEAGPEVTNQDAADQESVEPESSEQAPLLPAVSQVTEQRRTRRPRRSRSARNAPASPPASAPIPPALLRSADHSINVAPNADLPEIGVAALPASAPPPPHLNM